MVDSAAAYLASHSLPASGVDPADAGRYYSFDWGDIHFTSVDSNLMRSASMDRMLAWLDQQAPSAPATVARMIAASALQREETRGAHVRTDHPVEDPALTHHLPCPVEPSTV